MKILIPAPPLDIHPRPQPPLKRLDVRDQHPVVGGHGCDRRPPAGLAAAARRLARGEDLQKRGSLARRQTLGVSQQRSARLLRAQRSQPRLQLVQERPEPKRTPTDRAGATLR